MALAFSCFLTLGAAATPPWIAAACGLAMTRVGEGTLGRRLVLVVGAGGVHVQGMAQPVPYKVTAVWTDETLPAAIRNAHSTKPGTWGLLKVLEGRGAVGVGGWFGERGGGAGAAGVDPAGGVASCGTAGGGADAGGVLSGAAGGRLGAAQPATRFGSARPFDGLRVIGLALAVSPF